MAKTVAEAEEVALAALRWLAAEPDRLGRFLGQTGAGLEDVAARAGEPDFLGFVLDFVLSDEATVLGFARDAGLDPDAPARARARLPGGDLPNWT